MRAMLRMGAVIAALLMAVAFSAPAFADHAHWLDTPGTFIGDIGSGQTSISDEDHGGHHRFHNNVHVGVAGTAINDRTPVSIGRYPDE